MLNRLKNKKKNSKFFKFTNSQIEDNIRLCTYYGWNKSLVSKIIFKNFDKIDNFFIKKNFPNILNKEKIFIITSGKSKFKSNKKNLNLRKFDAISVFSDNFDFSFECQKDTQLFIVSSEKFKKKKHKCVFFNFKKDIKIIDIWGGQCLSRPYSGVDLNIVLFDLKRGFKFSDIGHSNEQITWLISGSMKFYSGRLNEKLTNKKGIDIGPFHKHGGLSNGAIGFDAFFPKRIEKKYKHKVNLIKF
jgi:hypothetical protein|tara:strand:+ start:926 stop:1657 length:732 start_codon:yes stop_codon:yes gene_type:complete